MTKMASTLEERTHSRHSRASNPSVSEVIPFQSPYKSSRIVVAPTVEQLPKTVPPPPAPQPSFVSSIIIKDHEKNPNVAEQPWYFGVMGRGESNRLLDGTPGGTFIVRWSVEQQQYALSISVQGTVKHLKVEYDAQTKKYYLHEDRFFDTMILLINYHRINNLNEAFNIDVVLKGTPLKGTLYRAIAPFQGPEGKDHYITLRTGDMVTLLDTSMDNNGWWKGSINCSTNGGGAARVGYFPATYVKLVSEHATVQQPQQPPPTTPPLQTNNNNNTNVYQNGFGVQQQQQQHYGSGGTVREEMRNESIL
uniref:SH3 domain-containing protein n=1 Tax=Globodera pallida TaxID=36090 RepID=A0A183BNS6_GLOPA